MSKKPKKNAPVPQQPSEDDPDSDDVRSVEELLGMGEGDSSHALFTPEEMESPELEKLLFTEEEYEEFRELRRKEEEAFWAKHGRPPQWRKTPLALIPRESGIAPGESYNARWTEFLAYTRSWRVPAMVDALAELAAVANVSLWLSTDRMSGVPPKIENTRICFLADTDADGPACLGKRVLPKVELVFRASARRSTVRKTKIDGVRVCPHENGRDTKVTCITCARCLFKTH